jgi:dienelactone hydrolase
VLAGGVVTEASIADESPVFVPCGEHELFGVLTQPASEPCGVVLLLWGAAGLPSFGKNLILARLARRAADAGFAALRFDYLGTGDSSGSASTHRLDEPLVEEVEAACAWLRAHGLSRVVLIGSCSGARIALAAAQHMPEVAALALMSPPVMDYTREEMEAIKRAIERNTAPEWASSTFLRPLQDALARRQPILLVYGTADRLYEEFVRARQGRLGKLLERAGPLLTVCELEGWVHADPSVAGQERVIDVLGSWLDGLASASVRSAAASG